MRLKIVIHRPNSSDIEARKEALSRAWERLQEVKRSPARARPNSLAEYAGAEGQLTRTERGLR